MAVAVNLALGRVDLPGVQGSQGLREEPVAAFGNTAEPSGNEPIGNSRRNRADDSIGSSGRFVVLSIGAQDRAAAEQCFVKQVTRRKKFACSQSERMREARFGKRL
jgi:hypothetical protein